MEVDPNTKNVFLGSRDGKILNLSYNDKNVSNIVFEVKLLFKISDNLTVTGIQTTGKKEIVVSLSNGAIMIYSHGLKYPECNYFKIIVF